MRENLGSKIGLSMDKKECDLNLMSIDFKTLLTEVT